MMNPEALNNMQLRLAKAISAREEIAKLDREIEARTAAGFIDNDTTPTVQLLGKRSDLLRIIEGAINPPAKYMLPPRQLF